MLELRDAVRDLFVAGLELNSESFAEGFDVGARQCRDGFKQLLFQLGL